jgi:hypothetical protein
MCNYYFFCLQLEFVPKKFEISKNCFGFITDIRDQYWLNYSLILKEDESLSLGDMTKSSKSNLLYRASRDGFTCQAFHSKCDGKLNTLTIIKNNLDYVFGGYASSAWDDSGDYINDPKAFLFSLRRDGVSCKDKFTIKNPSSALFGHSSYGPTFGGGHDIYIYDSSNLYNVSYSNFGHSFCLPAGYTFGGNAQNFLAGNYNKWLVDEIEVYQIYN